MTSKLDPHKELILTSLLEGSSYASIADLLKDYGCNTAPANVFYWAKSRAKKLVARSALVNPIGSFLLPAQPVVVPAAAASPVTVVQPARVQGTQDRQVSSVTPGQSYRVRSASVAAQGKTETESMFDSLRAKVTETSGLHWKTSGNPK